MMKTVFPPTPPPGVGIGFEPAKYRYPSRRLRSCTAEKHASNWIWNQQILATHTFSPVPQSSLTSSEYWPHSGYIPSWSLQPHQTSWFQYTCRTVPKVVQRSPWIRGCVCSTLAQKYSLTFWRSWEAKKDMGKSRSFRALSTHPSKLSAPSGRRIPVWMTPGCFKVGRVFRSACTIWRHGGP